MDSRGHFEKPVYPHPTQRATVQVNTELCENKDKWFAFDPSFSVQAPVLAIASILGDLKEERRDLRRKSVAQTLEHPGRWEPASQLAFPTGSLPGSLNGFICKGQGAENHLQQLHLLFPKPASERPQVLVPMATQPKGRGLPCKQVIQLPRLTCFN